MRASGMPGRPDVRTSPIVETFSRVCASPTAGTTINAMARSAQPLVNFMRTVSHALEHRRKTSTLTVFTGLPANPAKSSVTVPDFWEGNKRCRRRVVHRSVLPACVVPTAGGIWCPERTVELPRNAANTAGGREKSWSTSVYFGRQGVFGRRRAIEIGLLDHVVGPKQQR